MIDEGYIKFNCIWIQAEPVSKAAIFNLNTCRDRMYNLGLIGAYPDEIGYGNLSIRLDNNSFLISGSTTGNLAKLDERHYVRVTEYSVQQNSVTCRGPIKASSESLTHAMIYECSPETNAVLHIHNLKLWQKLMHSVPTTADSISYGTPEIADEIKRLFAESNVSRDKIIVMGGHTEGIITFGKTIEEAEQVLMNYI